MSQDAVSEGLEASYQRKLARSILGVDDADKISGFLAQVVGEHLGWNDPHCFLLELSVGAVFGVAEGEKKCILKVFSPDAEFDSLESQSGFQQYLSAQGFPCPPVILGPMKHEEVVVAIEGYLDKGRRADGHLGSDRRLMATSLADLIALGEQYPHQQALPRRILQTAEGSPWPQPHNVLFDFAATEHGAEWIDDVGWRFKGVVEAPSQPPKIGHMDWGAKHFRIDAGQVSAIYDWDSVVRIPEARIVGEAAISFATTWYVPGSNRPSLDEALDFLNQYQLARRKQFTHEQTVTLVASMLYGAGYAARCEYAIKDETGKTENCEFLAMLLDADLESHIERLRLS